MIDKEPFSGLITVILRNNKEYNICKELAISSKQVCLINIINFRFIIIYF
jgi:hypothetical protein